MTKKRRPNYSPEFKLESALLVVNDAAEAMGVARSTLDKWVRQLRVEQRGQTPKGIPMTPEQLKIRELEKKIKRIEEEKEILKKATALLMSDSLNNSH